MLSAMVDIPGAWHGACTRSEAISALGRHGLQAAVAAGALVSLWPRVLVDASSMLQLSTRAAAALLLAGPEAILCGPTAARLHGCSAASTTAIHVLLPYNRRTRRQPGLQVHQGRLEDDEVLQIDGLPVLGLATVVAEMLCGNDRKQAIACADQALAMQPEPQRPQFMASVEKRLAARIDRRGTRQAASLLQVVDARSESPPESWLRLVLVEAGFPIPEMQYRVLDLDGKVVCRLDLAWPELKIALEYDGYEAHAGRAARDSARDEDLSRRGWLTVRATAADLRNPSRLLTVLSNAFQARRAPMSRRALAAAGC